jgi:hypothetical protein
MSPASVVLACLLCLATATSASAATITVNLSGSDTAAAIAGTATAVGPSGSAAATAGSSGVATITVPAGTGYKVTAGAIGYAVASQAGVASGDTVNLTLTASGTKFTPLPVFGGANGGLYADGQPGTFYAQSTQIPQLYRTTDWGGTWAPITVAFDDATNGIAGTSNIGQAKSATTSGFPGELAAFVSGTVYYSKDFGVSWKAVAASPSVLDFPDLQWGHVGSRSILVDTTGGHQYLADMTAGTPTFSQMTTDYTAPAGSVMRVANGGDKPYVAVADTTGTAVIYELTTSLSGGPLVTAAPGFPTAPLAIAFGGLSAPTGPPSGIAVSANTEVGMTVKLQSDGAYPTAKKNSGLGLADSCASAVGFGGAVGGVTADSGTVRGTGSAQIGRCWLNLSSNTTVLTGAIVSGGGGFAIDTGWGTNGTVSFVGGSRGPVKSTTLSSGVPVFNEPGATATAGTGAGTGGSSVNGITAPTVEGQVFGPTAPDDQATILHGGFGGVGYASSDGGVTVKIASRKGGWAVDWWQGVDHKWLAFGTPGGSGNVLAVQQDWTSASTAVDPNLGTTTTMIAGSALDANQAFATAMAGTPGGDTLFVGISDSNGFDSQADGTLRRVTVSAGPAISAPITIGAGTINTAIHSLAYCPTAGSAASMADVLLVATGTLNGNAPVSGALYRVTGATTGSPVVSQIASVPAGNLVLDVAATCANGTVFAGTAFNTNDLFKSTDGGVTFTPVTSYGSGYVRAIGINKGSPNEMYIGIGSDGKIMRSIDTGATWTVVNDPATGHNFSGDGIVDILIAPSTTAVTSLRNGKSFSGLTARSVLVAGSGAYSVTARPAPGTGGGGGGNNTGGGGGGTPPATGPGPPVAPGGGNVADRTAPRITNFTVSPTRPKSGKPAKFGLTLSEPATVKIVIERAAKGWRKGAKCVAAKPKSKPRRCTRYLRVGALTKAGLSGTAVVAFAGKLGGRALKAGAYRARATATDPAGNASPASTLSFSVTRK